MQRLTRAFVTKIRPSLLDVERLSLGERATRRGVGSRQVPHRLNQDEKLAFALATKVGYAVVHGRGQRRERKGSPLLNTLRQRADALAEPMVWVERADRRGGWLDCTCVDLSPLRCTDTDELRSWYERCKEIALDAEASIIGEAAVIAAAPTVQHTEVELATWPIWALQPCELRFSGGRRISLAVASCQEDLSPLKRSKRLAALLAAGLRHARVSNGT